MERFVVAPCSSSSLTLLYENREDELVGGIVKGLI